MVGDSAQSDELKATLITQLDAQLGCDSSSCVQGIELSPGSVVVNASIATNDELLASRLRVSQALRCIGNSEWVARVL